MAKKCFEMFKSGFFVAVRLHFLFFLPKNRDRLIKKETKKIKASNKKAENFNMILKSRNSPQVVKYFEVPPRLKQP